jgi:hypothetical protein
MKLLFIAVFDIYKQHSDFLFLYIEDFSFAW